MQAATTGVQAVRESVDGGAERLLRLQRAEGCWIGRLATNVCMEAEYVMLAHCLQRRDPAREAQIARGILARQGQDGAWRVYPSGPGDLDATVEAYQALKLLGLPADAEPMAAARSFVQEHGGIGQTRVFTRVWLALLGQYPWGQLPVLPPELVLLPPWAPLNPYAFASWARGTIVPMAVLMSRRPTFPVRPDLGVAELGAAAASAPRRGSAPRSGLFTVADRLLRGYQRMPWHPGRRDAERRALQWVLEHQEADGSWGGIQPPWVYSLLALRATGHGDHPAVDRGWHGIETYGVQEPDGSWWLQACVSPVWDTAFAVLALRESGLAADHPDLVRAGLWLCDRQTSTVGDWRLRRPRARPGGWAFEFANERYPDVDDTAIVLMALRRLRLPDEGRRRRSLTAGFRWMLAMQGRSGGWAAFDADNTSRLCARIPFCDFGAATDPPTEDVTGHVLESLGLFGYDEALPGLRRGVAFLRRTQQADGSWWGRWGVNHVYGTGAVLPGLAAAGLDMGTEWVRRAVAWLEAHQNEDGGWGESCASYVDPAWRGRGESTPSQTAWGLLGLLAAGKAHSPSAAGAARFLASRQRSDGGWDEAAYTGTGFPGDFYIGYGLYRDVFPVLALARYQRLLALGGPDTQGR